jgi:tetratricopeptide (TPR) repeat protein
MPDLANYPDVHSSVYHHLGFNYYKLSEYDKSIVNSKKSLEIKRKNNIDYRYNDVSLNVSLCYIRLGKLKQAREIINEIERSATLDDLGVQMEIHFNLGQIHLLEKDTAAAENNFLLSLDYARKFQDRRFELDNLDVLASINLNKKNLKLVEYYLSEAIKVPKNNSLNREVLNLYARLGEFHKAKKDFRKASLFQDKYTALNDSIFSDHLTNSLVRMESEYVEFQNQERIREQAELLSLKDEIIRWQYLMIVSVALALGLVMFTLYSLYRKHQNKKYANIILEDKVRERTDGFNASLSELTRVLIANEERMRKMFQETSNAMTTIGVLCSLGSEDWENRAIYFEDIRKMSLKVMQHIERISNEEVKGQFFQSDSKSL